MPRHNTPSSDHIVRITRKQRLTIRAPRQTHTLGLPTLLAHGRILRLQLVHFALFLQIEDDDGARRGGAEPVAVRGEDEGVDLIAGGQRVEVLGLVQIPEHGGAVLAARGAEGAVGGDGDGVDVSRVADMVSLDAAGSEFPYLKDARLFVSKEVRRATSFYSFKASFIVVISALVIVCLMARKL